MRLQQGWPRISVAVEQEEIPVATMSPTKVPDAGWRYVDKKGHGHFWVLHSKKPSELPTLEWVVTGKTWVGDEYDGSEIEIGEYRCRLCAEVVEPGKRLDYGPSHIPGLTWITVVIDGETFIVDPDGYARSVNAWAEALRKESR